MSRRYVAVCGTATADVAQREAAREVGRLLAEAGAVLLCGGLGGVMEAASEGASVAGGTVVGILPGSDREGANPHLTFALPTGLGQARNAVIATAAESVIAIGGGWGTLSEIGFARRLGRTVVALDTWRVDGLQEAGSPAEAVRLALG
jgi:uncharacterized protein (TIGR00725 family)